MAMRVSETHQDQLIARKADYLHRIDPEGTLPQDTKHFFETLIEAKFTGTPAQIGQRLIAVNQNIDVQHQLSTTVKDNLKKMAQNIAQL